MKIESYACGAWTPGSDDGVEVRNAINGESIGWVSSKGLDFADMLNHGRNKRRFSAAKHDHPRPCQYAQGAGKTPAG